MAIKEIIIALSFLVMSFVCHAQQVTNVDFHVVGKQIVITYDLDKTTDISIEITTDGGASYAPLGNVTGAVGKSVPSGNGKRATWDVLAERRDLIGERIGFRVLCGASKKSFTVKGVTFEMIHVEGGTFTMNAGQKHTHQVSLSDYYIGQFEVTQELWTAVMSTNVRQQHAKANTSRPLKGEGRNYPMYYISWNECQEFIYNLNKITGQKFRLPTEAEWEFAARGGNRSKKYLYSGSNNISSVAWHEDNSSGTTHPVGTKDPNELGIYDMSGNVWEWCADWHDKYSDNAQTNHTGPTSGHNRVLRGGCWQYDAWDCRVTRRYIGEPDFRTSTYGFRLAL